MFSRRYCLVLYSTIFRARILLLGVRSPGFIGREWIETTWKPTITMWILLLPALLVGSGLKPTGQNIRTHSVRFSRLYWSGVD